MTEAEKEQRRYALAISGGFRNYFTGVAEMEIEKIINGLKTAKDKIEKEINFLQSVDITSGKECLSFPHLKR